MDFEKLNSQIADFDEAASAKCKENWDAIAKPLNGLGYLEDDIQQIAGLTGTANVKIDKRGVLVMCSDNGVYEEDISQSDQSVTAAVAENLVRGDTSVCRMANYAKADVFPVNLGIMSEVPGAIDRQIAPETANFTKGPAMTPEQTEQAIQVGIDLVEELAGKGYNLLATGEMGIGNTTTSAALTSVLLDMPVDKVTGRGSGLSDQGLLRKRAAIKKAIEVNEPDPDDAFDCLSKLGGFDIAAMAGAFIGGAIYRVPMIIDGVISACGALVAYKLCPRSQMAMIASHISREPAAPIILEQLGLKPLICANMHLGEGTGAVAAMPLLDMALAVYEEMVLFSDTDMEAYVPLGGELEGEVE